MKVIYRRYNYIVEDELCITQLMSRTFFISINLTNNERIICYCEWEYFLDDFDKEQELKTIIYEPTVHNKYILLKLHQYYQLIYIYILKHLF